MKNEFSKFFVLLGSLGAWVVKIGFVFGVSACLWAYDIKDDREVSASKPVHLSSFQMIVDRLKGLIFYKGNVKATHDNVTLTADEIRAITENREATAEGKVKVVDPGAALTMTCGNLEYLDKMNLMTAHDHPSLVSLDENGRPITVLGRQMELDSEKKTVVIHQDVRIFHDGGQAEAQKATFLSKEDKFIMEEDPKLTMPNGQLSGRRIISNLGLGRSVLVEGMADAVFYPSGMPRKSGASDKNPVLPKMDKTPLAPMNTPVPGSAPALAPAPGN